MKNYSKPEIAFVNFGVKAAADCSLTVSTNSGNASACTYDLGGGFLLFLSTSLDGGKCSVTPQNGDESEFCYHVPIAGSRIFHS